MIARQERPEPESEFLSVRTVTRPEPVLTKTYAKPVLAKADSKAKSGTSKSDAMAKTASSSKFDPKAKTSVAQANPKASAKSATPKGKAEAKSAQTLAKADTKSAKGKTAPEKALPKTHLVKANETLFRVAVMYDTSVDELKKLNKMGSKDNTIKAGQVLKVKISG